VNFLSKGTERGIVEVVVYLGRYGVVDKSDASKAGKGKSRFPNKTGNGLVRCNAN
jgi:hypothetical protein